MECCLWLCVSSFMVCGWRCFHYLGWICSLSNLLVLFPDMLYSKKQDAKLMLSMVKWIIGGAWVRACVRLLSIDHPSCMLRCAQISILCIFVCFVRFRDDHVSIEFGNKLIVWICCWPVPLFNCLGLTLKWCRYSEHKCGLWSGFKLDYGSYSDPILFFSDKGHFYYLIM